MKVEMDMPELPDGWEYTGEYRTPTEQDCFYIDGTLVTGNKFRTFNYPIVRKVLTWRPATIADVERALKGEKVTARFRNDPKCDWCLRDTPHLLGAKCCRGTTEVKWIDSDNWHWDECEVLDG